jgi:predicted PurR-regulated permease PerM
MSFGVTCRLSSLGDAVLKHLFPGRAAELPMPVILIGGIGGLIFHGLIGLFVGAVVFSIGYRLIVLTRESSQEAVAVSGTAGFGDDGG